MNSFDYFSPRNLSELMFSAVGKFTQPQRIGEAELTAEKTTNHSFILNSLLYAGKSCCNRISV